MSETITVELLSQLLGGMPGVAWSCQLNPSTGENRWLYLNAKAADFYDVPEAELRADPAQTTRQMVPEDRERLTLQAMDGMKTLTPIQFSGRIQRRSGEIRWIELQTRFEREPDGSLIMYGQAIDVTSRKQLEEALAASESARRAAEAMNRAVLEVIPVGVMVMTTAGEFLVYNPAQQRMGGRIEDYSGEGTPALVFRADGVTIQPVEEIPIMRALAGEEAIEGEMVLRNPKLAADVRLRASARPIRDASGQIIAAVAISQDITSQRALEDELRERNEQLAASEEAKTALIDRLRYSIDELSNPILEVWDDVLVMPIIGIVDSRRTADMVQRLLTEVARTQASFVIVDLTGVEIVDTKTADHLMKLMRKVEIVGARCVLTGIRPAVAETLVDIGVDFGKITTLRNLKHGLREALRSARLDREGSRNLDLDDEPAAPSAARRRGR